MPAATYHKLNNPAWYALTEMHQHFAEGNDAVKRYQQNIAPFAGCIADQPVSPEAFDQCFNITDSFYIIGDLPLLPSNYNIESKLLCLQMIAPSIKAVPATARIAQLSEADDEDIITLMELVFPGYYQPDTRLMGDYFGIRCNGKLVAITGERMQMNGLTEVSAVVTHPDFTGRKYAQQLVSLVAAKNLDAGIIPFLHTAEINERAIKVYELLGFIPRRIIAVWKIKRVG